MKTHGTRFAEITEAGPRPRPRYKTLTGNKRRKARRAWRRAYGEWEPWQIDIVASARALVEVVERDLLVYGQATVVI